MIIDKFENLGLYVKDDALKNAIVDFLLSAKDKQAGKYAILGETYANVLEYVSKPFETVKMEAHRKYIDLQYIVSGEECVLKQELDDNQPINEYNEVKDVVHYSPKTYDKSILPVGAFGLMFPNDLHQCVASLQPAPVKKVVVKIPVGII